MTRISAIRKRRRKAAIVCGIATALILWIYFGDALYLWWFSLVFLPPVDETHNNGVHNGFPLFNKSHILEWRTPPALTQKEIKEVEEIEAEGGKNKSTKVLKYLSHVVQSQLLQIQTRGCGTKDSYLFCGHQNDCGFGCQVHHRMGCLMASYALNIPLIHDEASPFPYAGKWEDVFLPYGSSCPTTNTTIVWIFRYSACIPGQVAGTSLAGWGCYQLLQSLNRPTEEGGIRGLFPLSSGIPVDERIGRYIEGHHKSPFLWMASQFAKYVLRPDPKVRAKIDEWKKAIIVGGPIVGIHVRRTDKLREQADSAHPLSVYMRHAEEFFGREEEERGLGRNGLKRRVLIASDEFSVMQEAHQNYKDWEIHGHQVSQKDTQTIYGSTYYDVDGGLESVFRDVLMLASTDYMICGYSSNICRLVLELFADKTPDPKLDIVSLDGEYNFVLKYFLLPARIVKIPASS